MKVMVIRVMVIMIFWLSGELLKSQNHDVDRSLGNQLNQISELISRHKNHEAIERGKTLLKSFPASPDVLLAIGLGYINLFNQPDSALYYLKKAQKLIGSEDVSDTYYNVHLSLAKAYQQRLLPDSALHVYDIVLRKIQPSEEGWIKEVNREADISLNEKDLLSRPVNMKVTNLGNAINTRYDEHSPLITLSGSQVYFTSRRLGANVILMDDGQYTEKIYKGLSLNGNWTESLQMPSFYKKNDHESAVSLSANDNSMFIFKNDLDGKNLYVCYRTLSGWTVPQKLPWPINSYDQETHCSLSADESTLFFTSDREGGLGGMDIYMVKRLPNGVWGEARNLGENINTPYDEETPMIYMDGKTLFFASEGHNSMGMFDIFSSEMLPDSTWSKPVNLGYPLNTPGDDMFFVPTIDRNRAYYASSQYADNRGGMDIYLVEFEPRKLNKLAVLEGRVISTKDINQQVVCIKVTQSDNKQLVGDYRPDKKTGEYTLFLEPGKKYVITEVQQTTKEVIKGEIDVPVSASFSNNKKAIELSDIEFKKPQTDELRMLAVHAVDQQYQQEMGEAPHQPLLSFRGKKLGSTPADDSGYTIQLLALKKGKLRNFRIFKGLDVSKIVEYRCTDGFYRYAYSSFATLEKSLLMRKEIQRGNLFKDAFVRPELQLKQMMVISAHK
jgi:hypothetical protein